MSTQKVIIICYEGSGTFFICVGKRPARSSESPDPKRPHLDEGGYQYRVAITVSTLYYHAFE